MSSNQRTLTLQDLFTRYMVNLVGTSSLILVEFCGNRIVLVLGLQPLALPCVTGLIATKFLKIPHFPTS
jgi:hypothetical protein